MTRRKKIITQLGRRKLRLATTWHDDDTPAPMRRAPPPPNKRPAPAIDCPTCGAPLSECARQLADNGKLFFTMRCGCGYLRIFSEPCEG